MGSLCLTQAMLYPCRGSDFGREVLNQVGQLQEQCTRLQEAAEQLWGDSKDTQKADETTLETKASQDELQSTMAQLSEMMQDLLRRMFLHGQDRHKASELMREMNSKVAVSPREDGGPPVYSLQREGKP